MKPLHKVVFICIMSCFTWLGLYAHQSHCKSTRCVHSICTHAYVHPLVFSPKGKFNQDYTKITDFQSFCSILSVPHPFQVNTIVIDPGHGGRDHGCSGFGSKEKDIVLKIAQRLGRMLHYTYPEVEVIFTRKKDVFVPLHRRAAIANTAQADLFISIHCNAMTVQSVYGSETYVMGLHTVAENLSVAKRENATILLEDNYHTNYEGYDPNSSEGHILMSMFQNAYLEQSILFAQAVEAQMQQHAGRKSRGVKQAGFMVLRQTTMPSVLIETGYLTNRQDNAFLASELGQKKMAECILNAFRHYRRQLETAN